MIEIFLSRADHDKMLDSQPSLLKALFATGTAKWCLAGVEFTIEHITMCEVKK